MTQDKVPDDLHPQVDVPSISESALQAFVSRLTLVIPLGLGIWAALRGLEYGAPANYLTLFIAMSAVLILGQRRPLTGAALMVLSGIAEWHIRSHLPGLSPFPIPLASYLLTAAALVLIEVWRPTLVGTNYLDSSAQDESKFWRLMVLATPALLAFFIGFSKTL